MILDVKKNNVNCCSFLKRGIAVHLVMVTTNGVAHNNYYNMIQNEVTMDDLFLT